MRYILIIYFLGCWFTITAQTVVPDPFFNKSPKYFSIALPDDHWDNFHEFDFWFFKTMAFRDWVVKAGIKCLIKTEEVEGSIEHSEFGTSIKTPKQYIAEYYFDNEGYLDSLVFKTKEFDTYSTVSFEKYLLNPVKFSEIPYEMTQLDKNGLRFYGGTTSKAGMKIKPMNYAIDTNGIMLADVNHKVKNSAGDLGYSYSFRINAIYGFENGFRTSRNLYGYNGDFWIPWASSMKFEHIEDDISIIQNRHVIYHDKNEYENAFRDPTDTAYFSNFYVRNNPSFGFEEFGYRYVTELDSWQYVPLIKKYSEDRKNGKSAVIKDVFMSKKLYLSHYNDSWFKSMFEEYYMGAPDSILLVQREVVNFDKNKETLSVYGYGLDYKGETILINFIERRTKKGFEINNYNKEGKIVNKTFFEYDIDGLLQGKIIQDSKELILLSSTKDSLRALDNQGKQWLNFEIVYR